MVCILVATVLLGVFDAVACNCEKCEPTSVVLATQNCVAFKCSASVCRVSAVEVGEQCERASNETATCICKYGPDGQTACFCDQNTASSSSVQATLPTVAATTTRNMAPTLTFLRTTQPPGPPDVETVATTAASRSTSTAAVQSTTAAVAAATTTMTTTNLVATSATAAAIGPNTAVIAGAAGGGAAALLLLVGLAVFCVCRARKAKARNDVPPAGNELRASNYGSAGLGRAPVNDYDVGNVGSAPPPNQYGAIDVSEARYADASVLTAGGIQVRSTGVGTNYSAL